MWTMFVLRRTAVSNSIAGIKEAAVAGDRENLLRGPHDRGSDAPGKGDAWGLLAVRDEDLAGPEAIEMASDPQVKRTHVPEKRNVATEERLQFMDETQRMDRRAAVSRSFLAKQLAFGGNRFEDCRRKR